MNPTRQHTLTKQDLEVIRSFVLPIQMNVPLADNPKAVTVVLLMLTTGMIEHTHFGTPEPTKDLAFESDESGYGLALFQQINELQGVEAAAITYLRYLRTGRHDIELNHPALTKDAKSEVLGKAPKSWSFETLLRKFGSFLDRCLS